MSSGWLSAVILKKAVRKLFLETAEQWRAEASLRGVDILVFPESLMHRAMNLDKRSFASEAESIDGPFCCGMDAHAARYGLWLVYTVN